MKNAKEAAQAEDGRLIEAARLKEKIAEVTSLQEALQEEGQTSSELKAALEEERKKAEAKVSELKAQVLLQDGGAVDLVRPGCLHQGLRALPREGG